eukprot:jgi/Astpho2/2115/fgenesh1_pg.00038_%23_170_t
MSTSVPSYKLKRIQYFRREVPIALQNENGPCPLLAIANVLLLRNQITLPANAPDVSQDRLVSLVAEHLLDSNNEERLGPSVTIDYKANLQRNIEDAITLLPKLTTGIDVNVRFDDVHGFEFTDEVAIFDLLDVSLVHGWLVDPQEEVAASIGQRTYNELVSELVTVLGSETPKSLLTPQRSGLSQGSLSELAQRQSSGLRRLTSGLGSGSAPAQSLSRAGSGTEAGFAAAGSTPGLQVHESAGAAAANMQQEGQGGRGTQAPLADVAEAPLINVSEGPAAPERQHSAGANHSSQAPAAMQLTDAQSAPAQHQAPAQLAEATSSLAQPAEATSSLVQPAEATSSLSGAMSGLQLDDADSLQLQQALELSMSGAGLEQAVDQALQASAEDAAREGSQPADGPLLPGSSNVAAQAGRTGAASPAGAAQAEAMLQPAHHLPAPAPAPGSHVPAADSAGATNDGDGELVRDLVQQMMQRVVQATEDPRTGTSRQDAAPPADTAEVQQQLDARSFARLVHAWMERTCGQLTPSGLDRLRQDLRPNELAVFFRNNHFNAVLMYNNAIHILVTDQGYEFEKDVVWERLDDTTGDTQFLRADFCPYGSQSLQEQVAAAAQLAQEAFSSVLPPQRPQGKLVVMAACKWDCAAACPSGGAQAAGATAGPAHGQTDEDADFAYALSLQEHEQEAARQQRARHQEAAQQQDAQQQDPRSGRHPSSKPARSSGDTRQRAARQQALPAQQYQNPMYAQQAPSSASPGTRRPTADMVRQAQQQRSQSKKDEKSCAIM